METWGQKTPTQNNNPEENPEDTEHTNPQTTPPQPNCTPQTTQPIITAPRLPPAPPIPTHKTYILPVIDH
jgi:hypothetical protein